MGTGTVPTLPGLIFPLTAAVALALFYEMLVRRPGIGGLWIGWGFGIGLMGFGVFGIRISLNEFGNVAPWLVYLLTSLFVLGMALYYGLVCWVVSWLSTGRRWVGSLLAFPVALVPRELVGCGEVRTASIASAGDRTN